MHDDHAVLIDSLGGGSALAEALWGPRTGKKDRRAELVYAWKKNGVAWKWRPAVARIANERGVALPADFLPAAHESAQRAPQPAA